MSEQEKPSSNKPARDSRGRLLPGHSGNLKGRKPDTEEDKIKKKATKQFIQDYVKKLAEALPEISPALIKKARSGDISAIREVNDRVMGKPKQSIEVEGELKIYQWGNGESDNLSTTNLDQETSPKQS